MTPSNEIQEDKVVRESFISGLSLSRKCNTLSNSIKLSWKKSVNRIISGKWRNQGIKGYWVPNKDSFLSF